MKLLQINSVYKNGSTGRICQQIDEAFRKENYGESKVLYFWGNHPDDGNSFRCSNNYYAKCMALKSRITGDYGFVSKHSTKKAIKVMQEFSPDIIHLHNIHDHSVDLCLLFDYLQNVRAKIIWTFHDCWAFTGYCSHYSLENCYKWKEHCNNCSLSSRYSWFFDHSNILQNKKRELYGDMRFDIVTPSKWLAKETKNSFLGDNNISIIYNGIDLLSFKPTNGQFKAKYGINNKKIILGVAYQWDVRKGFDVFLRLSEKLDSDYIIVLVGNLPKGYKNLPKNIISLNRTSNQRELAELYTCADVFVNPTREEVLGLVNIEALSCGTPVITFDSGGSPECIDGSSGVVVRSNELELLTQNIYRICKENVFKSDDCINRARLFNSLDMSKNYLKKYSDLMQGN